MIVSKSSEQLLLLLVKTRPLPLGKAQQRLKLLQRQQNKASGPKSHGIPWHLWIPQANKGQDDRRLSHKRATGRGWLSDLTATVKALTSATQKQAGVRPLLGFFSFSFMVVLDRADEEATSWAAGTEQLISGGERRLR